jgi:uncharacterized membrane protein YhhN
MKKRTKILSIVYFLTGVVFIILSGHSSFMPGLVTKALIIPILIVILFLNLRSHLSLLTLMMISGLLFSWFGDVILEYSNLNERFFIPGLLSFLIAHIMYLLVFFITPGKNSVFHTRFYLLIPVLLSGAGLIYYLYKDLGDMRIPVIFYAVVILTMLSSALNRIEKVNL